MMSNNNFNFSSNSKIFESYDQKGGNGFATLIRNKKQQENQPFRMVYLNDTILKWFQIDFSMLLLNLNFVFKRTWLNVN